MDANPAFNSATSTKPVHPFFVGLYFSNIISQTDTFICCIQILVKKPSPSIIPIFVIQLQKFDYVKTGKHLKQIKQVIIVHAENY